MPFTLNITCSNYPNRFELSNYSLLIVFYFEFPLKNQEAFLLNVHQIHHRSPRNRQTFNLIF